MVAVPKVVEHPTRSSRARLVLAAVGVLAFLGVGLYGVYRYLDNFWLYRGYPPPHDPAFVTVRGTTVRLSVVSAALGGRAQPVVVYLPPGYSTHPRRRYPALYLLHGFPGRPDAFLRTVRLGVLEDVLVAKRVIRPLILVMPFGSTGTFTDEEWANGVRPASGWETFVARDLVRAIDRRFRTIRTLRGLAGLSEGGYGALNIGLHHPREFRVLESWSGYVTADNIESIFAGNLERLAWNSPLATLPQASARLRRIHAYIWMYSGNHDRFRFQNAAFAAELARHRIPHRYFVLRGGHDWSLWRGEGYNALLVAASHLRNG
jgi:enterochelin esterase-like enzyme